MRDWLRRLLTPSPSRFTALAIRALRATGAPEPVRAVPGQFAVAVGEGEGQRFFLDNAYRDYALAPMRRRRDVLAAYFDYAALAIALPARYEEARPGLLPKVRERFFHECLRLQRLLDGRGAPPWEPPPSRPMTSEFVVELVWDQPLAMAVVAQSQLDAWGVSFEEALEHARENLWARSGGRFERPFPGVHVSAWRDTHDASRAFLHDLVWHLDVAGDPVVFLPHRNALIVTGADDAPGLVAAARAAEEMLADTRAMSAQPLRLAGREWQLFEPPPGHPSRVAVRNAALLSRARHYGEQKRLLDHVDVADGVDVFHASCSLVEDGTGARWTYTVWGRDVVSTLPEAEWVAFIEQGPDGKPRPLGRAPWPRVREVMKDAMQRRDLHPPRFAVDRFPDPDELARLKVEPF